MPVELGIVEIALFLLTMAGDRYNLRLIFILPYAFYAIFSTKRTPVEQGFRPRPCAGQDGWGAKSRFVGPAFTGVPQDCSRTQPVLAAAEVLIKLDRLRAFLETKGKIEVRERSTAGRKGDLDVIADAAALGLVGHRDMHRKRLLAENRLVGASQRNEVVEVDIVATRRGSALGDDDIVERGMERAATHRAGRRHVAEDAIPGDVERLRLARRCGRAEHRRVRERMQNDGARARWIHRPLLRLLANKRDPAATRKDNKAACRGQRRSAVKTS